MRILLLFALFCGANAVTCPSSGCTYGDLGCQLSGNKIYFICYRDTTGPITGPLNITNIPSEVEVIELTDHQFTNISVDMFDGLAALTMLWLYSNRLTTLPTGVFDKNTALTELRLNNNKLTTLPDGRILRHSSGSRLNGSRRQSLRAWTTQLRSCHRLVHCIGRR